MSTMQFLADFLSGALLCNCVPHLVCGLQGAPFPTPFAQPRGIGDSAPWVNFLWGFFNLLAAICIFLNHPLAIEFSLRFGVFLLGAFVFGGYASMHFGKVRRRAQVN